MLVYIKGLDAKATLYLYNEKDEDIAERFVSKLDSLNYKECECVTEDVIKKTEIDIDWTDVKFIMSQEVYEKYAQMFEIIQNIYDRIADYAIKYNKTTEEICAKMVSLKTIKEDEMKIFLC